MNTVFLIISLVSNFGLLILVSFIFFKIEKMAKNDSSGNNGDRKLKRSIGKKVSSQLSEEVDSIVGSALASFNDQIKLEISKISDESMNKLRGISEFTQEQEKTIGRETQFLVANNFAKVEKELEEYKKTQLAKVDGDISEIVAVAAQEVLGRALSAAEHEELVNKALEKAKREKFFT